jgi:hypothetical protein
MIKEYINTYSAILFSEEVSENIHFVLSRNLEQHVVFLKNSVCTQTKKLTVGKTLDLYKTHRVLSNGRFRFSSSSLLFITV